MANKRLLTLGAVLGAVWLASVARVFQIQVLQSSRYGGLERSQSRHRDVLPPQRGEIFDRGGTSLVANMDKGAKTPGFRWSRLCPNGRMAGQILGVVSHDGYGQSGLELHLDRDLRGTDGWRYARYDARNRYTPGGEDQVSPPVNGMGVRLSLDSKVQEVVEHALERGVTRTGAKQGVAIVVEPFSGDILAMANYPFFDPNTRESRDGENWKNNAVSMVYEPGSAFKVITAGALLQERRMAPSDTVDGEGGTYRIAGEIIHDSHPVGRISFTDAMAYSSNISFAKMSMRLQSIDFYKYIRSFGFGMKTGVTLPAEESGRIQPVSDWSARSEPTIAFGHEISVTPLQMAMAYAAVANNGILMRPRVVRAWVDGAGRVVREEPPREIRRVLSDSTAATLRNMMRTVVDYGTAAAIKHPYIPIAGKTGTAEKIDPVTGRYLHGRFHSSFIGMAPVDHPAFVCLVMLDEPSKLKYGGQSAAPVFREILDHLAGEGVAWPEHKEIWAARPREDSVHGGQIVKVAMVAWAPLQPYQESTPASRSVDGGSRPAPSNSENACDARTMPDLRNATLRDALSRLREFGLEVEYQGEGKVVEQEPAPGSPLRHGLHCRLRLGWMG